MKRFVAMLMALLLLFGGVAMAANEDLNAIVRQLEDYLDMLAYSKGNGVDTTELEQCMKLLEETRIRNKKPLELYCSILLAIEKNQFANANGDMFVLRRESMAKNFEEDFVKGAGGDTPIATVEQLYNYLKGREAEYGGKLEEALAFYHKCLNDFDAYDRAENIKWTLYDSALNFYRKGEYEQARSMLEELARMQYPEAVQVLAAFVTPTPPPTPTPVPLVAGDCIKFGSYPQTAAGNDNTPIEWLVLENDGETVLLISRYGLDCQPYNTRDESTTWEQCTLRSWLNEEFYNCAFSSDEKKRIVKSNVSADENPEYSTNPGRTTKDNVFLLSVVEARKYFKSDEARRCAATDYAIQSGAYKSSSYKVNDRWACWWWLRSPGCYSGYAAYVFADGSIYSYGVSYCDYAVRPCVRVRLF